MRSGPLHRPSPEEDDAIREWYLRVKLSIREIAKQLGMSHSYVFNRLEAMGIKRRRQGQQGSGKCVDCGKECGCALRCGYHLYVRHAELHRDRKREREKIPKSKWRTTA